MAAANLADCIAIAIGYPDASAVKEHVPGSFTYAISMFDKAVPIPQSHDSVLELATYPHIDAIKCQASGNVANVPNEKRCAIARPQLRELVTDVASDPDILAIKKNRVWAVCDRKAA